MSDSAAGDLLRARRVRSRYLVARDHPAPERVRARLDTAVRSELRSRLRAALAGVPPGDTSLWFIRELSIDLSLDASWDAGRVAAAWTRHIAGAVRTVLVHGPDGDGIVRFASRAEYLGRFLVETATGTAWSRWFFARFAGLRALPASGVIRSAIVADPEVGLAALGAMTAAELMLVVETLSPADAMHVARGVACGAPTDAVRARDDALRSVTAVRSSGARTGCEERLVLRACIECGRAGTLPDRDRLAACRALVRLSAILASISPARAAELFEALAANAVATMIRLAGIADAEVLGALSPASEAWLASAMHALAVTDTGVAPSPEPTVGPRDTPFGSLFLLLPQLVGLRLETLMSAWPDCDGAAASLIVRFLVALAAGSGNARRDWYDGVARDVMGIAPSLSVTRAGEWSAGIAGDLWSRLADDIGGEPLAPSDADFLTLPTPLGGSAEAAAAIAGIGSQVVRRFAAMLPGFARSSAVHLFINFLDVHASLEDEPLRRVVRLGRPPLDLVLRMTGIGCGVIAVPWLDERPFTLFPAEGA